jgi:ribosomal RNA-processing protein 36
MPRRPRPAHRAPPGQIRKSSHRAPPLSTKAKIVSKVQLGERNSKSSKVTLKESTFSEDFKQGSTEMGEDKLRTLDALKRRREEEDEGEEDEDEEVDVETDIDADADAPRVVQWLDDEDDTTDELKQKVADDSEVRLYFRS